MKQEHQQNMYHTSVNVSLMVEIGRTMVECKFDGRTQIKNVITINVVESVKIQKNIMSAKRYIYLEFCYMKLRKWSIFRKYY